MPTKPDLIVFLCPNGHRLNGPSSLEGKPGQCPHCGVKFRVPTRDDPIEDEDGEEEPETTISAAGSGTSMQAADTVQELSSEDSAYSHPLDEGTPAVPQPQLNALTPPGSGLGVSVGIGGSGIGNRSTAMAEIFLRLWNERDRGSVIELHLATGQVIAPEKYSRSSSRRGCGVFAVRDPDGTYTITAVPWEGVARITVRHLSRLPKKMFE